MKNHEQVGASTRRTDLDTTLRLCRTISRPKITILSHTYSCAFFHTFSNFPYLSRTFFLQLPRTFSNFHLNPWGPRGTPVDKKLHFCKSKNILKPPRVAGGLCPPGVLQGPLGEKVQIAAMTAKVAISVGQGSGRGDGSEGGGGRYD